MELQQADQSLLKSGSGTGSRKVREGNLFSCKPLIRAKIDLQNRNGYYSLNWFIIITLPRIKLSESKTVPSDPIVKGAVREL